MLDCNYHCKVTTSFFFEDILTANVNQHGLDQAPIWLLYNPTANFTVFANVGQQVGLLGQWVGPIHYEQNFLIHLPRTFQVRTETPSTFLNIIFAANHTSLTAATK